MMPRHHIVSLPPPVKMLGERFRRRIVIDRIQAQIDAASDPSEVHVLDALERRIAQLARSTRR